MFCCSTRRPRFFQLGLASLPFTGISISKTQQSLGFNKPNNPEWTMSQYTGNNRKFSNNTNAFNVWNNSTFANDRSRLLALLSSMEPGLKHSEVRERRINDVGEWLTQTKEFRRWCGLVGEGGGEGDNAVLFCYGDPGVGKTFIR